MATGHLRERIGENGKLSYQLVVEEDRDPMTGKRERHYKTMRGSKKQAEAALRKMIVEIENGGLATVSAVKLSDWMETWLATYLPNIAKTTRDSYEEKVCGYIIPELGSIAIKNLKNEHVQQFVNRLIARGLSPKTIRNAFNNLNAALKKAVVLRKIPFNPCVGVELPKLEHYEAKVYDLKGIQAALAAAEDAALYVMILLGGIFGLRRGEMAALKWRNIDFENKTLTVKESRVHTSDGVEEKGPKTHAGKRTVSIGNDTIAILKEIKVARDALVGTPGYQDLGFVLCQENGKPYHPDSITQKWKRFLAQSGLPFIRLHDLRHSNATILIAGGVPANVVQKRLGHADVSTTLRIYTHVLPSMDQEAAEECDKMISLN